MQSRLRWQGVRLGLAATVSPNPARPFNTSPVIGKARVSQVIEIRTLQEIDDEAAGLRASLDDVERRLAASPELQAAREQFGDADAALGRVRREQRRLEGEVESLSARINPEEKRLYDGSVRNPKELTNIQHEVENLKRHRGEFEDQLLEIMTQLEAAEARHATSEKELVRAEARREAETADLRQEAQRLQGLVTRADARRLAQQPKIVPRNLKLYEDVRRRKGGVAVARVSGGTCGGCRVSIPEAVRRRAFSGDEVAQCPNCERILYVG